VHIEKNASKCINQHLFLTIGDFFLMKMMKQIKSYYIFDTKIIYIT